MVIRRCIAYFLDVFLLIVLHSLLYFGLGVAFYQNFIISNKLSIVLFYTIFILLYIAYYCVLPMFWDGNTLFKKALGVRLNLEGANVKVFFYLLIKYLLVRLILTIVTFGLAALYDMIYIKRHEGQSLIDKLLNINVIYP